MGNDLPKLVDNTVESIISYDYTDFASGTGIQKFYLATYNASGTTSYFLTENQVYASAIEIFSTLYSAATYTKVLDKNFDLSTFSKSQTLGGTAYFNISFANIDEVSTGTHLFAYLVVKIRKVSGGVESEIANAQSEVLNDNEKVLTLLSCTVPKTSFATGDTLRITVEGWAKQDGTTDRGRIFVGSDPQNRDGTQLTPTTDGTRTATECYIPFQILE